MPEFVYYIIPDNILYAMCEFNAQTKIINTGNMAGG